LGFFSPIVILSILERLPPFTTNP